MIIATRSLFLRTENREIEIPIRIHAPEKAQVDWMCRFDIGWPEGRAERWGTGADAAQALLMALQMIGVEIYTSHYHESGRLRWLAAGGGYGFPVSHNARDLLQGDDAKFL
jgi:hypothetical protein